MLKGKKRGIWGIFKKLNPPILLASVPNSVPTLNSLGSILPFTTCMSGIHLPNKFVVLFVLPITLVPLEGLMSFIFLKSFPPPLITYYLLPHSPLHYYL